ncbi:MAG: hypothetical protein A3K65_03395, partial [Euryarchaeota archaeon RBG_16_68_12]
MQAVVVAGGFGTRLRPLTFNRPKPLVPLLNRPQVLHVLDRLPKAVDEVFLAVSYMADRVKDFVRETDLGRHVEVVEEATPMGTGGAVKNVGDRLDGTFAVYNGDVIDSLEFPEFLAFHRKRGALASIALYEVEDPTPFGVVELDRGRIRRFVEKPAPDDAPSRLINAGRYLFEPEVLDEIAAGKAVSMETEVFPRLAETSLYGFPFEGYWSDAGTLHGYAAAASILLANGGAGVDPGANVSRARLDGAVLIPEGCTISGRLGPDVVLGRGCRIDSATVSGSTLLEGAQVEAGAVV